MKKGIFIKGERIISPVAISSIGGHWGLGLMPLALSPIMMFFMALVRKTGTTQMIKSSTRRKHQGNFIWYDPRTYRFVQNTGPESMLNAYAHSNEGIDINFLAARIVRDFLGFDIIPNFAADYSKSSEEVAAENVYAADVAVKQGFKVIEFVPSCPNRSHCITENIKVSADSVKAIKRKYPNLIVIMKKGIQHPTEAAQEWETAGVDIIHGINAVPYDMIPSRKISPLQDVGGGGYSGSMITEIAFKDNLKTRKVISTPMIFGGGISSIEQTQKLLRVQQ